MTEEEIRPIAEKYVEEFCHSSNFEYTDADLICAGIGTALIVAKEKDKQIEELKKQVEKTKNPCCVKCDWICDALEKDKQIKGLINTIGEWKTIADKKDKQIEELEGQVTRAFEVLESKRKQIEELKKEVEKLKGCHNCENYSKEYELCCYSLGDEDYDCRGRNWKMKE